MKGERFFVFYSECRNATPAARTPQCDDLSPVRAPVGGGPCIALLTGMLPTIVSKGLKSIAANIRKLRLRLGMTQPELAKPAGLAARYVQTLESGKANPTAAVIIKVADALDVAPGALFREAPMHDRKPGRPSGHKKTPSTA